MNLKPESGTYFKTIVLPKVRFYRAQLVEQLTHYAKFEGSNPATDGTM
jgi:hypothetical protein